jgi:regulator of protease activity HflC (stomatin/prohibitin superfamily)
MRAVGVRGGWHEYAPDADPRVRRLRPGRRIVVNGWEQGLLFRHGRLDAVLSPGAYRRWRTGLVLHIVDLRPWTIILPTQEVPTADGPTVKVTAAGQVRITDPVTYLTANRDADQALYLAVQVALRELLAGSSVDDLLAGRAETGMRLLGLVRGAEALGVTVERLELKDIILPNELKRAQAEVLLARAQGSAALERARGETAALRNLANAARLAADNPFLVQLRLLQHLEASTGHTIVLGTPPLPAVPAPTATAAPTSGGVDRSA